MSLFELPGGVALFAFDIVCTAITHQAFDSCYFTHSAVIMQGLFKNLAILPAKSKCLDFLKKKIYYSL